MSQTAIIYIEKRLKALDRVKSAVLFTSNRILSASDRVLVNDKNIRLKRQIKSVV
ncbi:hypothetical protein L579_2847 [Pantoea sp. AS-PWVM4]|nr:hypothetical protein L579_2847 [Pantoea sp. AS-PWVM4]